jgi:hypothetical protein
MWPINQVLTKAGVRKSMFGTPGEKTSACTEMSLS